MKGQDPSKDTDVYGSGLDKDDWDSLRDVIWPFIHSDDPGSVEIPPVPPHLQSHPLIHFIRQYQTTGDRKYLDKAGQLLIPTKEPFGWYVPITK